MADSLIGQTIGKYRIIEKIGRGGMAEVYKANQINLDRFVAIKVMHSFLIEEEEFLARFRREAQAMAALNHPNIVGVFDFDTIQDNSHYLVMEYIGGGSLKEKMTDLSARGERLPLARSLDIALQITAALRYAHARGMAHRDIKPANIMLAEDGKIMLTDFGIVKMMEGTMADFTATGVFLGTPDYMAPEQALGQKGDERCDLYALGVLLFQMVTGQLPYTADTPMAVAMKHISEPTPLPATFNPDVPQPVQDVILKAMAKEPEHRYQTADEMAAALRAIDLTQKTPPVRPTPPLEKTAVSTTRPIPQPAQPAPKPAPETASSSPLARRRWPWILGVVTLLLLLLGGGAMIFGSQLGLPGFGPASSPTAPAVAANTAVPTPSSEPTTAVPTATSPPTATGDAVATVLAAAAATSTAEAPEIAVPDTATATNTPTKPAPTATETAVSTNTATPSATPTATRASNTTGGAGTGGGLPLGFETFGVWTRGDEDNGTFTQSSARVHSGSHAGRLDYEFGTDGNDYVVFLQFNAISGTPNLLQAWVYGDGSGHFLNAWIIDSEGETWQVPLGNVTHTGWRQMSGAIATGQDWPWQHISGPENDAVDYPIRFRGFVLDDRSNADTGQGAIYIDDLTATTGDVGSIPTAVPQATTVSDVQPTATTAVDVDPGTVGRILYTAANTLLTTDPAWSSPRELGTAVSDTCSSPATTAGQSYDLYYGFKCGIGATGTGVCQSPNGQFEVLTNNVDGDTSIVVRRTGAEELRFVYQGQVNRDEGIRWAPNSSFFLFAIDQAIHRAFTDASYGQIIPFAYNPTISADSSLILYRRPVGPGVNDVFVANADGSSQRNVTNVTAVDKTCAAWRR